MVPNPAVYGPATLAVTTGIQAFYQFMPKFSDVRRNHPDDDPAFAADVRVGEAAAVTMSIGIGLICSSLTGSPIPTYASILTAAVLVSMYECTLRKNRPGEPKIAVLNLAEGTHHA